MPDAFTSWEALDGIRVLWDRMLELGLLYRPLTPELETDIRTTTPWLLAMHLDRSRALVPDQLSRRDLDECFELLDAAELPRLWGEQWEKLFRVNNVMNALFVSKPFARVRRLEGHEVADFILRVRQGYRIALMFGLSYREVRGIMTAKWAGKRPAPNSKPESDVVYVSGVAFDAGRHPHRDRAYVRVNLTTYHGDTLATYNGEPLPEGWTYNPHVPCFECRVREAREEAQGRAA